MSGEVYLVEHIHLKRNEALKIIRPELLEDKELIARFRREVRATNRVQHPNVVSIHDFGRLPDGRFFLSMEYASGENLRALLQRQKRLSISLSRRILFQLAEAMDHAHRHGVIHRDLKPENLILTEHRGTSDVLKVLDFGIAKIVDPDYKESFDLSIRGELLGTVCYIAPERIEGAVSDARQDIYAFGCIAYEMIMGVPPFEGSLIAVIEAHLQKIPGRPSDLRPDANVPPAFDKLVARCLEKDPSARIQTAAEVVHLLREMVVCKDLGSVEIPAEVGAEYLQEWTRLDGAGADSQTDSILLTKRYRDLLLTAGETLLDLGLDDLELTVALAEAQTQVARLLSVETEMERNRARAGEVEQAARTREGSLRFALGELEFAHAETLRRGEVPPASLTARIADARQHLIAARALLEAELRSLDESAIVLAVDAATIDDAAKSAFNALADFLLRCAARPPTIELGRQMVEIADLRARLSKAR